MMRGMRSWHELGIGHFSHGTVGQRHGGVEERCRDAEVVMVGLGPPSKSSMGTYMNPACKVFDTMPARKLFLNFAKSFYGCDSNNVWHLVLVLVCKFEWFCKNPKCV
jgi:hypothetical protein